MQRGLITVGRGVVGIVVGVTDDAGVGFVGSCTQFVSNIVGAETPCEPPR